MKITAWDNGKKIPSLPRNRLWSRADLKPFQTLAKNLPNLTPSVLGNGAPFMRPLYSSGRMLTEIAP